MNNRHLTLSLALALALGSPAAITAIARAASGVKCQPRRNGQTVVDAARPPDSPARLGELHNAADCFALGLRQDVMVPAEVIDRGLPLAEAVERFERSLIAAELQRQGGSLARTSEALRIAKTTLHDKIRKYGLKSEG